ncbi:NAD-dependent DNA ligase [Prochlorococcus marinus str. XMU1401]|uniref:NAD-dependent DNA ligase n=1 Tax=Prochlorococcus marinus str. XMU1401 TaxID=2052594 RepID=A0A8I2BKB0_PROMR|nr:NAD-dependent DNA ligase [Prochlorococcus marinus]MBO8223086.1 NAD-dependent DNA ligase [Prochlorococcus marinus str. XMU1401]MBW3059628.1 NAD-dependent DNA ligase [Prochlorococcus marinus str. XMU1401E]
MTSSLEKKVKYYDDAYRAGRALITDKEFDKLERNLLRIAPQCDYFNNRKSLPLPSLPKDQISEFLEGLLPDTKLLIQPKIDGCAVAIKYENGKLEKAISRKGSDITQKIKTIKSIPREINIRSSFVVRGELFTAEEAPSYSQRIASGYLRSKDYQPNPKITFCAFQIINSNCNEYESLIYCRKLGFTIPEIVEANRTSQVETFRQAWKSGKLFSNWPTDGIVVKINSRKLQLLREKSYGTYPHSALAIKY